MTSPPRRRRERRGTSRDRWFDESERLYRRALSVLERAYGPDHEEVAATLHNLAGVLAERGECEEAECCYRRTLAIKESVLGDESPDTALTRNNLGWLLCEMGRRAEAVPLLARAVTVLEQCLTPGHPVSTALVKTWTERSATYSVGRSGQRAVMFLGALSPRL